MTPEAKPESTAATDTGERTDLAPTIQERTSQGRTSDQTGNVKGVRHGLKSNPALGSLRLAMGNLPKGMRKVELAALSFRKALEAAVADRHGCISLVHALAVNTAARWERHAALCLRWLREHEKELTHGERLAYSREIAQASGYRDKAVAQLRLDAAAIDAIAALYRDVDPTPASMPERSPTAAPEASIATSPSPATED